MILLYGTPISNYYNKVKLALLEKALPFEERLVRPGSEAAREHSPLGKVPYLVTEQGALCESQAICEYLEALAPQPALLPAQPWAAAKVRELCTFVDLHLELVARELYPQAFFGGTVSESTCERVRRRLEANIVAFRRLAVFAPHLAGEDFTLADCAAYVSLPLVGLATRQVLGQDLLDAAGVDWRGYTRHVGTRASAQRVDADRRAAVQAASAPKPAA